MKKKIGIATIVALNNYGAILQGLALVEVIKEIGYDAEVIDVRTKDQDDCSMFVKVKNAKDILRNVRKLLNYTSQKKRMDLFGSFAEKFLPLSPNYYSMSEDEIVQRYDYLCTGSDQTFNVLLNAFKPEYYLTFTEQLPKFSYASSFGETCEKFTDKDRGWIKKQLCKYSKISVREKNGVELVKMLTGRNDIVQVLDPTLLMTEKQWKRFLPLQTKKFPQKYIVFYSVLSEQWVVEYVKRISLVTGLPVIAPHLQNSYEIGAKFERYIECGPAEFLELINNAELVLTTSFHATVFSYQFKKRFYSFILGEGNRIGSFLENVGLSNRAILDKTDVINIDDSINFEESNKLLHIEREKSMNYLVETLKYLDILSEN